MPVGVFGFLKLVLSRQKILFVGCIVVTRMTNASKMLEQQSDPMHDKAVALPLLAHAQHGLATA